jgi:hypothetical protein
MSHTNLITINSTEINNSGPIRVGDDLSSGTAGQVLKSQGDDLAPEWGSDSDTTYQGSATILINPFTTPYTINCIKVPNTLTFTGYDTGTFDGSSALSINLVDTNTTYSAGDNINIGGPGNSISVNQTLTNITSTQFKTNGTATTIIGSDYPSKPTVCTYLDLTSATNILPSSSAVSPFLGTKIQQTYIAKTFSTTYAEYSSNFRMSFVALSANALVEFQAVIAAYSRIFYGALYDYNAGSFWTTPQTQTRFKYDNGVDQDPTTLYWYLTGLTAGTTYYISPYFKGSSASVYVYAGNSGTANQFAPGIFRVSDGGDNVGVY